MFTSINSELLKDLPDSLKQHVVYGIEKDNRLLVAHFRKKIDPSETGFWLDKHENIKPEMAKEIKYDLSYLNISSVWGENSHSTRKKVGAILVKDNHIISDGFNGTPTGFDNACEDDSGNTHWYVIHAESNALMKIAKSNSDCTGATLYTTSSPCKDCSKLIIQAEIVEIVFNEVYRITEGLELILNKSEILVKYYPNLKP